MRGCARRGEWLLGSILGADAHISLGAYGKRTRGLLARVSSYEMVCGATNLGGPFQALQTILGQAPQPKKNQLHEFWLVSNARTHSHVGQPLGGPAESAERKIQGAEPRAERQLSCSFVLRHYRLANPSGCVVSTAGLLPVCYDFTGHYIGIQVRMSITPIQDRGSMNVDSIMRPTVIIVALLHNMT